MPGQPENLCDASKLTLLYREKTMQTSMLQRAFVLLDFAAGSSIEKILAAVFSILLPIFNLNIIWLRLKKHKLFGC